MISRKPGFFIDYLRKNKNALSKTFQSIKDKKKEDEIVHSFTLTNPIGSPLPQEIFNSILEIHDAKDQSVPLSQEEFKEIFDVITKEGFSELFYSGCPSIKKDLSNFLQKTFPGIVNFDDPIFLLRAYTYSIWLSFLYNFYLSKKTIPRDVHRSSNILFTKETEYFKTRLAQLAKKSAEPSASTDTAMVIGSTLLTALCAIEAPLFLLFLIPIIGSGFYSRYTNGYYFFKPNNTDTTDPSNEAMARKTAVVPNRT